MKMYVVTKTYAVCKTLLCGVFTASADAKKCQQDTLPYKSFKEALVAAIEVVGKMEATVA